jgi:S1-C subfamily serine protease
LAFAGEADAHTEQPQQDAVGVLVSQVLSESSAALAGIVAGDVITKIEDKEITDFDSLIEALAHRKPGQSVALSVVRSGEHREIAVKLQGWYVEKSEIAQ